MNKHLASPEPDDAEEPARKKRGALLVLEHLREEILWMRLAPGSALDEVMLANVYGVSRTPVREALLLLVNEGFVQFLQNRTTIVAPLSLDNLGAFLDTFILLSRGLIRAATLNQTADRAVLGATVATFAAALNRKDDAAAFRAQLDLYRAIAALAENRFLGKYFLEAQDASVRMKLLYFFPHLSAADRIKAVSRMTNVVEALVSGDAEAADSAVRAAIRFETGVIQRGLDPRFAYDMQLGKRNRAKETTP